MFRSIQAFLLGIPDSVRNLRIRKKVLLLYIFVVVIPLVILGILAEQVMFNSLKSDFSVSVNEAIEQIVKNIEFRKLTYELLATRTATDGELGATCDYVKAKLRGKKDIKLSFDEWNVWFHSQNADAKIERWQVAPPLLEDKYDMTDALVVGTMLNTLIRNADRVKIACLAQLVNVIAPIMTRNGGPAWRQTIYWPFLHASLFGRGQSLGSIVDCGTYDTPNHSDVPWLDISAVFNEETQEMAAFCVNRSPKQGMQVRIDLNGIGKMELLEHIVLRHDDLFAVNTESYPDNVSPKWLTGGAVCSGIYTGNLPSASWNVLRFKTR